MARHVLRDLSRYVSVAERGRSRKGVLELYERHPESGDRASCPLNTVDENAARIVAAFALTLAAASLWPAAWWLVALLSADFFVRAWVDRRYSPLRWTAKAVARATGLAPHPVYAPPKRFAARIGSALTLLAVALHVAGAHVAAVVATGVLIVAASAEAFLGFCVACWVYPVLFGRRQTI